MKIQVFPADTRGSFRYGWLEANYSFSFNRWYDPSRMNFGLLRVLNDDRVAPGGGFGTHPHDNMEIITIPLAGALEHRDSTGTHGIIKAGDVQVMSAGTGITHSEMNASQQEEVRLLQIWIFPEKDNVAPRYDQKSFPRETRQNQLLTIVSPDETDDALRIHQEAWLTLGALKAGATVEYKTHRPGHGLYAFLIDGSVQVANGQAYTLQRRDAAGITDTEQLTITAAQDSELLLIEVPMH
ncbi:hypothetical protein SAMN05421823_10772 [Catalinimonas alkaloidigena]|uniref:Pirin family protein n=1 Tax=Catalinimonas alkaloidigena TaxID=1075417 RepID=A0A1G9LJT3_9BACT|nr:pirin family protein [Catalinimonas alkaloidigena]SDL62212.1 hypothetical protein SAMN05421823_10772 [Catalinimonas alkaloidigena]